MGEITTTFVGLDTHKVSISVTMLIPSEAKPVEWQCTNRNHNYAHRVLRYSSFSLTASTGSSLAT
jgi:hypothetical protein